LPKRSKGPNLRTAQIGRQLDSALLDEGPLVWVYLGAAKRQGIADARRREGGAAMIGDRVRG